MIVLVLDSQGHRHQRGRTGEHLSAGLEPGKGLFASRRIPTTLDPTSFSARGLAHPRPDQAGTQRFFTAAGRPFCLYVVISGARGERRRQGMQLLNED